MGEKYQEILFPYEKIRESQDDLIKSVKKAVETKTNLLVHAPTGLGKTVASLGPALKYAIENKKTIFFLTSRHTQHLIAIETLKQIKKKFNLNFNTVDIIGKRWMCSQPGMERLMSRDFNEFCKLLVGDNKCEYYNKTKEKNKITVKAAKILNDIEILNPLDTEEIIELAKEEKLCAYELSVELAKKSTVVIADYYYIFNPGVRLSFFAKTNKKLEDSIIIVDEGHNLAARIRDLLTERLTNQMVRRAIKEAKKQGFDEIIDTLVEIHDIINEAAKGMRDGDERIITKERIAKAINNIKDYDEIVSDLDSVGEEIRSRENRSYVGSIADFLESWVGEDEGFARIISMKQFRNEPTIILSYRNLDPAFISKDIVEAAHSTIIMSGTLTPTSMYKDLLGFKRVECKEYKDVFPKKNRLNLIIPETTTKYDLRSEEQFERMAEICADIVNEVKGNTAIFFPSYNIRNTVNNYFQNKCKKSTFLEHPNMTKGEKTEMLERFKRYKGAVLLGVASGSFGEGIDLPGVLKCVIVVGLPLQKPDLETQELIKYYDSKYGKGWEYGYIMPAFTKTLQSAGRCIRSEKDNGVIIFLDARYIWNNYYKYFPKDWDMIISKNYNAEIKAFFDEKE